MNRGQEYIKTLKDKNILIAGLGKSGLACIKVLSSICSSLYSYDMKSQDKLSPDAIDILQLCEASFLSKMPDETIHFDLAVFSPGLPLDSDIAMWLKSRQVEIIGELELAYRLTNGKFIAITGTNGKTTTTTLLGEIFKASGRHTHIVGNIGNPVVLEAIDSNEEDYFITESSSFQLETTCYFKPEVSAILNLTEDHLNRHHSMQEYARCKSNIFQNQSMDDFLILNADDKNSLDYFDSDKTNVLYFSTKLNTIKGAYYHKGDLYINLDSPRLICHANEIKIIGIHNIMNVLAAALVAYVSGIELEIISMAIKKFNGVEHRIEFVADHNSVKFYNDSKGTNVDSVLTAIDALENNIFLIAGGDGKSQNFTPLTDYLEGRVLELVLFGRDAKIIADACTQSGYTNFVILDNLDECVDYCISHARPKDKVLLSPACASWDMYPNYEERGRHFKRLVLERINGQKI